MKAKKGTAILKTPLADCWLEGHILCIVPNNAERTAANIRQHYTILKGIVKDKLTVLIDMGICQQFEKNVRNYIDKELPSICKALAINYETSLRKNGC